MVDDAFQGITEVVRGSDLLESTARQIHLQQALGLPTPSYLHHPLAVSGDGKKLGKRFGSDPVGRLPAAEAVSIALRFLGQKPPGGMELKELWSWACEHWQAESIPQCEMHACRIIFTSLKSLLVGYNVIRVQRATQ